MPMQDLSKSVYFQQLNAGAVAITDTTYYPASGSFIDISGMTNFAFKFNAGALNSALTFAVYENSTTSSSGATAVSGATFSVAAADDNRICGVSVSCKKLLSGSRYVSVYATGAAGSDDYGELEFIGYNEHDLPVTQLNAVSGVKNWTHVPG